MTFLEKQELVELENRRDLLVKRKIELSTLLAEVPISDNNRLRINKGTLKYEVKQSIGDDFIEVRRKYTSELFEIDGKMAILNKRIGELKHLKAKDENMFKLNAMLDILEDNMSREQIERIRTEVFRRADGLPPTKVDLGLGNTSELRKQADTYRDIAKKSIDSLMTARKNLTSVIDKGCEKFDKGYFLQVVSPLNVSLPRIEELNKLKRLHNL